MDPAFAGGQMDGRFFSLSGQRIEQGLRFF